MSDKGKTAAFGLVLIVIGAMLLLGALGVQLPSMQTLWPLIVIAFSLFVLYSAVRDKPIKPDSVWFGTMGTLVGFLFAYITLGPGAWGDLRTLWPLFPLIAGVAWLVAYASDPRQIAHLVAALIAGAVGVVALLINTGWLEPYIGRQLLEYWPLILVALGLGMIVQYLVQRR